MSFSLEETGTDQTNPIKHPLQNRFWRGCFMVRFPPPPPKIARYVLPPPFANSQIFWNSQMRPRDPDILKTLGSDVPPVLLGISWPALAVPWRGPSKKGKGPNRTGGSTILKLIWEGNLLYFPRFRGSPTVRNLEIQNVLWERFQGVSGLVPDFTLEILNRTRGTSNRSEKRLIRLNFWDTLWEQFCLSDQSALIDASLWRKPL